jgi:hypothetical protein
MIERERERERDERGEREDGGEERSPGSVTEESRLQSILAISVVSTKNASLRTQPRFGCDGATIR